MVGGARGVNIRHVQAFLLFREKVGHFPTKPVFTEEQIKRREKFIAEEAKRGVLIGRLEDGFNSPVTAAFCLAWEPYRSEYGPIYDTAALVYEQVKSGQFLDEDSRYFQDYESLKAHK